MPTPRAPAGRSDLSLAMIVHRLFLLGHRDRVANLYAVELRVGDGVREKSGRGGVARSRPNGRSPASEDGEAHAWLGPAALLGPASPDLTTKRPRRLYTVRRGERH